LEVIHGSELRLRWVNFISEGDRQAGVVQFSVGSVSPIGLRQNLSEYKSVEAIDKAMSALSFPEPGLALLRAVSKNLLG
jgi:hypothetical protein